MNSDTRIARLEANQSRCRKAVAVVALLATCGLLAAAACPEAPKDPPSCTAENRFKPIQATIHSTDLGDKDNCISLDQLQYMFGKLEEGDTCLLGVGTFELMNPGGSLQVHENDTVHATHEFRWYQFTGRVTITNPGGSGATQCIYRRI